MGIITEISPQQKHQGRLNVFIDGKFAFGISELLGYWLRVGQNIDEKKIEYLLTEETFDKALTRSTSLLNRHRYTEKGIREKLTKYGFEEATIDQVIARLREDLLLDDLDYARAWINFRNVVSPKGKALLKMELRRKGVADELIETALSENEENEDDALLGIAKKCYAKVIQKKLPAWQTKRKFLEQLQRRGFNYSEINRVWETITKEQVDFESSSEEETDTFPADEDSAFPEDE